MAGDRRSKTCPSTDANRLPELRKLIHSVERFHSLSLVLFTILERNKTRKQFVCSVPHARCVRPVRRSLELFAEYRSFAVRTARLSDESNQWILPNRTQIFASERSSLESRTHRIVIINLKTLKIEKRIGFVLAATLVALQSNRAVNLKFGSHLIRSPPENGRFDRNF